MMVLGSKFVLYVFLELLLVVLGDKAQVDWG